MTTWDPSNKDASITLSNGNLTATGTVNASWRSVIATAPGKTAGKWYWRNKCSCASNSFAGCGVSNGTLPASNYIGSDNNGWIIYAQPGASAAYQHGGSVIGGSGPTFATNGDYLVAAIDQTNGKIYFTTMTAAGVLSTNWCGNSSNPSTNTGGFSFTPGTTLLPGGSLADTGGAGDQNILDVTTTISDTTLSGFLPFASMTQYTQTVSISSSESVTGLQTQYPHVTSPPSGMLGYQHLAPTTVTGLYVPPGARWAEITISGAVVSMRDDGVQPTATLGAKLPVGGPYIYASNLHQVLFYSASGTVDVVFYAP